MNSIANDTDGGTASLRALSAAAGLELGRFRADHVDERVRRALTREGVADVEELARVLVTDAAARLRFRRSVAVSVTGLFRDPAQFAVLEQLLPPLLARAARRLRVWSAGCADGSELASVALLLDRRAALDRAFLLGSDLLEENVERARAGTAVPSAFRGRLRWEQRDVVAEGAPPGRWQLVLCRNVAIYLASEARRVLHESLAGALAPGGVLLLGRSERLSDPRRLGLEIAAAHAYRRAGP